MKRRGKQGWEPCTNFNLRIEESSLNDDEEEVAHRLLLFMDGISARFTVLENELRDGATLLHMASAIAIAEGFPDQPRVLDSADLKRLPQIVTATQLKPALLSQAPSVLGFDKERLHGRNFTATRRGVSFHVATGSPQVSMLREPAWESARNHLAYRANQLATWLTTLEPTDRRMVSVVVHAALAWLHRGSRGLASYLLLPSNAHLDLLGALTGLVPIEVGRSREQLGAPRLMRSSYAKPGQLEMHGRIVAALEDRHRRIDQQLPIVVHQWAGDSVPVPPAGILSLLTHGVLGAQDPRSAGRRLSAHVECPKIRGGLQSCLDEAAGYLADSGRYLDTFLDAAKTLPEVEGHLIRKKGRGLLKRSVVRLLNEERHFRFRETRLIDEFRDRFPYRQPARYGREQVPVFCLPAGALAAG